MSDQPSSAWGELYVRYAEPKRGDHENTPVYNAFNAAVRSAKDRLTAEDLPMIAAARVLALKIDMEEEYFAELAFEAERTRKSPPSRDNASHTQFLNYLKALGFSPEIRETRESKKKPEPTAGGAGLRGLRAVPRPNAG